MAAEKLPQPKPSVPSAQSTVPPKNAVRPLHRVLVWPAAAACAGALLLCNSFGIGFGSPAGDAKVQSGPAAAASTAPRAPATAAPLPHSDPTRLKIPTIAVDAPFTALDLDKTGRLNPPPADNTNMVGWYRGGATPGERGASIVAGHVDTKTGPAVFLLLRTLKPGNEVDITRKDGTVATFKVDSVETFSKADFPDQRVYGDTPDPQLRLITCGGSYNKDAQDYEDNVVVFAHLASSKNA
ncbi:class F sortase [Streptomyces sp. NPDC059398]|uniref:class F sortase n=1 Tax=Streptomyces sp. NPDC059398 TaxID=3346820 RepID=UPI0036A633D0